MKEPALHEIGENGAIQNFMADITQHARDSNGFVLEIGPGWGTGSTLAIQRGLAEHPRPLHISVDQADQLRWRPEVSWWHLVIGDSRQIRTMMEAGRIAKDRRPGLIFIDTDHNYRQMAAELVVWSVAADEDTIWLFHDTHMWGQPNTDMVRAIESFAGATDWVYEDFRQQAHGLGRMRWKHSNA